MYSYTVQRTCKLTINIFCHIFHQTIYSIVKSVLERTCTLYRLVGFGLYLWTIEAGYLLHYNQFIRENNLKVSYYTFTTTIILPFTRILNLIRKLYTSGKILVGGKIREPSRLPKRMPDRVNSAFLICTDNGLMVLFDTYSTV
jgi:hypothetical protein